MDATRVRADLATIADLCPALLAVMRRQVKLGERGKAGTPGPRLPLDARAFEVERTVRASSWAELEKARAAKKNAVRCGLVGWVRVTVEDLHADYPDDTIPAMCAHLARHADAMAAHEAGEDFAAEIGELAAMVARVAEPEPSEERHIGRCDACSAPLVAQVPTRRESGSSGPLWADTDVFTCKACGKPYRPALVWAAKLNRGRGHLLTMSGILAFEAELRRNDPTRPRLPRRTLRAWIKRGRLARAAETEDGHDLYRWGDVDRLLKARHAA